MDNLDSEYQGTLFETINYKNGSDVRNLIDNLSLGQSIYFVTKSLELSHRRGNFNMLETEIISKSLSLINTYLLKENDTKG